MEFRLFFTFDAAALPRLHLAAPTSRTGRGLQQHGDHALAKAAQRVHLKEKEEKSKHLKHLKELFISLFILCERRPKSLFGKTE